MANEEFVEEEQSGSIPLKGQLDLQSVLSGQVFEINFDAVKQEEESNLPKEEDYESFVKACMDIDSDEESLFTSFDELKKKMTNVTDDGKVMKRIRREGIGETPPEMAVCSILYSSYLEYNDEPIDYAYIKKPYRFRLGTACLFGLNIAVQSMKVTEKAQFLVHPDYGFGAMGHPPRIPPNSSILFNIELIKIIDSGAALNFENLTIEDKKSFETSYKTALGLVESAKEHFHKNIKLAIRDYNRALGLIEECNLADISEQEEQQKLKLRILTNLSICHNKNNAPKRSCTACNEIYSMIKNTSLKIPAKVYFNHGRALFLIGDYQRAKEKLLRAQKLEPQNTDISNQLLKVQEKIVELKKTETEIAKKFIQSKACPSPSNEGASMKTETVNESFKQVVVKTCDDLLKSSEQQYALPGGLTTEEIEVIKTVTQKKGLKFRESKFNENGKLTFYIAKM